MRPPRRRGCGDRSAHGPCLDSSRLRERRRRFGRAAPRPCYGARHGGDTDRRKGHRASRVRQEVAAGGPGVEGAHRKGARTGGDPGGGGSGEQDLRHRQAEGRDRGRLRVMGALLPGERHPHRVSRRSWTRSTPIRSVHGILIQLPVPKQVDADRAPPSAPAGEGRRRPAPGEHGSPRRRAARATVACTPLGRDADAPGDRLPAVGEAGGGGRRSILVGRPMAFCSSTPTPRSPSVTARATCARSRGRTSSSPRWVCRS